MSEFVNGRINNNGDVVLNFLDTSGRKAKPVGITIDYATPKNILDSSSEYLKSIGGLEQAEKQLLPKGHVVINDEVFQAPFRVGRKNNRAILDKIGKELVIFSKGGEKMAENYCEFLNSNQ